MQVGGSSYLGHKISVKLTGTPIDVRCFGSGIFGAWLVCAWTGEIVLNTYDPILGTLPPPTIGTIYVHSANSTMTFTDCPLMDVARDIDAKGVEEFVYTWKVVGTPSIS